MLGDAPELSVSEFVALLNQTLEYAYPQAVITGEVANFRVSKNRWVYFDLKDETSSVRFFGTVYQMTHPIEDGMRIVVRGLPRLHPQFGFSVTVQAMQLSGEGTIKKAAKLLEAKLRSEGLFDDSRKRQLPFPPQTVGLVTSGESAAYHDFMKIITARWGGVEIVHIDVQVQGEAAPGQIVAAVQQFNQMAVPPDVLVVVRGGGSADDLQVFSTEQVTRAVSASRIPTLVAIGHEVDISLAELAADMRASTPSNAAELLVPDRQAVLRHLQANRQQLSQAATHSITALRHRLAISLQQLHDRASQRVVSARERVALQRQLLEAYNPQQALAKGYALVRHGGTVIRNSKDIMAGSKLELELIDARVTATVTNVQKLPGAHNG